METQKIVNFLNGSENENLEQKNGMLLAMSQRSLLTQQTNKFFTKVNRIKSL